MFSSFDYVIKEMINVAAVQPWSYGYTLGGLLSTQEARVARGDASFVLSNLPRASITPGLHTARLASLAGL